MINGSNRFHPTPRAILVTPIYDDIPFSGNGPSSERPELNQPLLTHTQSRPSSPLLINRSAESIDPHPEHYQASSSRRHDYRPYAYSPARDQRYDPNLPYYPQPYSRSYSRDHPRRGRSSDYYDSSDNGRLRDDDYPSDYDRSSDYDYPPEDDRSSDDDRFSDHDRSRLDHDRSSLDNDHPLPQHHNQGSSRHDRPSLDYDRPSPEHHNQSSSRLDHGRSRLDDDHSPLDYQRPSTQHPNPSSSQPDRSTLHKRKGLTHATDQALSKLQSYLEHNRQAASVDPFRHLKTVSQDVQRVLKALPPSPHFCWSQCTGQRKAVCVSISFSTPQYFFSQGSLLQVGINYVGQKNQLKGCANDAQHMRYFLMST